MSILTHIESLSRNTTTCDCGGTILVGATGTEQEHSYCDRCDWVEHRADVSTWYTWRTDAAHGGMFAESLDAAVAQVVSEHEWAEIDSTKESADITDGAYLLVRDTETGAEYRRGETL